jgi:hypothetical protein
VPLIGRVVLLADESAQYIIAGLSQLGRLLRTLEECFAPALAEGNPPEVLVLWKTAALREERSTRLPINYQIADQSVGSGPTGITLVLRSNVVFRRGALARLLRAANSHSSFVRLGAESFPASWEQLQDATGGARTDELCWVIESPADLPGVERQLVRGSGKPTDGFVSRTLNRPLSQLLSHLLVQTRITPNQISFLVLAVLLCSTLILARGTAAGFVIGMLLFHLASVLDGCDGEIARAKFLESRLGALLDTGVDFLGNFLLPIAIAVGLSREVGLPAELRNEYLLEGALTAAGIGLGIFGLARARPREARTDFNDFGSSTIERVGLPRPLATLLYGITQLLRRDSYVLLFVLFAVIGQPALILHFLAVGMALHLPVIAWTWWTNARIAAPLKVPDRF